MQNTIAILLDLKCPECDNTGNRTQQAGLRNTGSTSDKATWTENQ